MNTLHMHSALRIMLRRRNSGSYMLRAATRATIRNTIRALRT